MTVAETDSTSTAIQTVVAIDVADHFAHLYPGLTELLAAHEAGPATRGLEFFDQDGARLAPVFDADWKLTSLVRTAEKPEPNAVAGRLAAVFAYLAEYVRTHPQQVSEDFGLAPNDALTQIPQLAGLTLAEIIALLGADSHQTPNAGRDHVADSGSWWHNMMHNM